MRSVQTEGSTHAQRAWISTARIALGTLALRDRGTSAGFVSFVLSKPLPPPCVPFAPRPLRRFVATTDALTSAVGPTPVRPADLPASRTLSSDHSVSNHLTRHDAALSRYPLARRGLPFGFRFHRTARGHPVSRPAESSSSSYGLVFHLLLLPTLPRGNAVTFGYGPESVCPKRTCTSLTVCACRRTSAAVPRSMLPS
jgi:hypothetical protein